MHIRTLSATRLKSYEQCPKRMLAEMSVRTSSAPGDFGTAIHAALEWFHKLVGEGATEYDVESLLEIWTTVANKHLGWMDVEDSSSYVSVGDALLRDYIEAHPEPPEVISQEIKETFPIEGLVDNDGEPVEVACTYIIDRVDADPVYGYRVIDYKSQYGYVSPDYMRKAVQPFLYALALRKKYGITGSIPVTYVMLRQSPQDVTIIISQADLDRFEKYLGDAAQRILDDNDPVERLNVDCGFCIRKSVCGAWQKAVEAEWTPTAPIDVLAAKHEDAKAAEKAARILAEEIEGAIAARMRGDKVYEVEAGDYSIRVTLPKVSVYDPVRVYEVIGESALPYMRVGKTALDKEVKRKKGSPFSDTQKDELAQALITSDGKPGLRITRTTPDGGADF